MAKTLFFIEAFLLVGLSLVLPIVFSELPAAFIAPATASLVIPLAYAISVWPAKSVIHALRIAFVDRSARSHEAPESSRILEEMGASSRISVILGLVLAAIAVLVRISSIRDLKIWTYLGAYLALYALVNAGLWEIMAAVARRSSREVVTAFGGDCTKDDAFAAKYGLSPRESATAALIASGLSYKETAFKLGIKIRTVKAHMSSVYDKTGVASNVALVLLMQKNGVFVQKSNGAIDAILR